MTRLIPLALLLALAACAKPISCDVDGFRLTPRGASADRFLADNRANTDLIAHRNERALFGEHAFAELGKASGCP